MTKHTVTIVIPNWNGRALLEKHLPRVLDAADGAEVIVVDDASDDDSVAFVKKSFPEITIVEKKAHDGFSGTVNAGVIKATTDVVVLLNTDTSPRKNFLPHLLSHFENAGVFAVGCMDISHEGENTVKRGRGLAWWRKGYFVHSRGEVDRNDTAWVSGGSAAFRRNMWTKLGGMDEIYNPFYWEDIDLSYRALKAGYTLVFEPKSVVDHFHEEGKIKKNFSSFQVKTTAYRNQFIFIWKNLSDISLWVEHVIWTPLRLCQALLRMDVAFVTGYMSAAVRFPQVILLRRKESKLWSVADKDISLPSE